MQNKIQTHISQVIGFLNEKADYAVLRNYEKLPTHNTSRDIDTIITRKSLNDIKPGLIKLIESTGWKIVTYLHSDRLVTYVCGKVDENGTELVQWDFFINTSVFGILLMDAPEFLARKKFNGFLYHVDEECRFLDKYLYNRCVGVSYPEKYVSTRRKAEHAPYVESKIAALWGISSVTKGDSLNGKSLLLRAIASNLRHRPFALVRDVCRFLHTFTRNYLCSNTGFSIGFTGPDGSGKTTVIDLLLKKLGDVFRTAHVYYHFRPALFGNLGEVAHSAGIKKEVDRDYNKPHRGGRTGALSSLARLLYYSLDYMLGYFVKVKSITRITRLVIFDRYFTDIICDSRRSRIYLPPKFLYWFGKLFIPSLDYNILLTAGSDVILARKRELDKDGILSINDRIDYLSCKPGYLKVLNESTPEDAVRTILEHVFAEQHRKNIKRLG